MSTYVDVRPNPSRVVVTPQKMSAAKVVPEHVQEMVFDYVSMVSSGDYQRAEKIVKVAARKFEAIKKELDEIITFEHHLEEDEPETKFFVEVDRLDVCAQLLIEIKTQSRVDTKIIPERIKQEYRRDVAIWTKKTLLKTRHPVFEEEEGRVRYESDIELENEIPDTGLLGKRKANHLHFSSEEDY